VALSDNRKLFLCFENNLADISSSHRIVVSGDDRDNNQYEVRTGTNHALVCDIGTYPVGQAITIAMSSDFYVDTFALSLKVKTTQNNTYPITVEFGTAMENGMCFHVVSSGIEVVQHTIGLDTNYYINTPIDGNWHTYSANFEMTVGSTGFVTVYQDGLLFGTIEVDDWVRLISTSHFGLSNRGWSGSLDQVQFWDRVLTAQEIQDLEYLEYEPPLKPAGSLTLPTRYFKCNEGTGDKLIDTMGVADLTGSGTLDFTSTGHDYTYCLGFDNEYIPLADFDCGVGFSAAFWTRHAINSGLGAIIDFGVADIVISNGVTFSWDTNWIIDVGYGWRHIATICNGSTQNWYLDGEPVVTAAFVKDFSTDTQISIGRFSGNASFAAPIKINDLYLWNSAVTQNDIIAAMNNTLLPIPPSALSYSTSNGIYTINVAITSNTPTVTGDVVSYSVSPALPSGIILNTSTGIITGTPDALQSSTGYVVTATGSVEFTTATIYITVNDVAPSALSYSTSNGIYTINSAITSNTPTVIGDILSYSVNPSLPSGLILNTSTGIITGTPDALQSSTGYVVTATNTGGFTTETIYITVNDVAPSALSYSTSNGIYTVGIAITSNTPTVTGTIVSYSINPGLQSNLVLNPSTGIISGDPTYVQVSTEYTITATNTGGYTTATIYITVNAVAPSALSYSTSNGIYTINSAITSNTPTVTGDVVSYSVSPALPSGIILNTSTGIITGTPDVSQTSTGYTITATNTSGFTTAIIYITVVYIAPSALSYSTQDAEYIQGIAITPNIPTVVGTIVTWSVSPALPSGLALNTSTGIITGTPV